jgi:asparagine synthase (glutamine-hydrolysing)
MCGYLFVYSKKKISIDKKKFLNSSKLINHRGPDDFSTFYGENIAASFYRLSIRDITTNGRQPMLSHTKKKIIVFNGEIYNSNYLKSKIDSNKFLGDSDTEILINYFEKYKEQSLENFKGMFSFVIYDFENKKCILARDRFGIKPLYYYNDSNFLIVCSEIKPILKFLNKTTFDEDAFADFLLKGHMDHGENTFFNNIKSLPPATYKIITQNSDVDKCYWNIGDKKQNSSSNLKNTKAKLKNLFNNAIQEHLESDVEIGSCLSGGNDSSSIASKSNSLLNYKMKTFTYEFKDQVDNENSETFLANKFAKKNKMKNFTAIVTPKYVLDKFDELLLNLESPITSLRLFGIKKLYEEVKKQNIKVMLEGHGGDEMLAGYDYNYMPWILDKNNKVSPDKIICKIFSKKNISRFGVNKLIHQLYAVKSQGNFTSDGTPYLYFNLFKKEFLDKHLFSKKIRSLSKPKDFNLLKYSQFLETKYIHLPRVLKYVDRLSMISGVESRVPFLDHELFSYCFGLKNKYKIKDYTQRWIWKKTFKHLGISSLKKKTITDPQKSWFKTVLRESFEDEINSKIIKETPYFDQDKVKSFYKYYKNNSLENSFVLMQILSSLKFIRLFKSF